MDNEKSYFETRIFEELGITKDLNIIEIIGNDPTFDTERKEKLPIFFPDKDDNICIRVFNLHREIIYYLDKKNDNPQSTANRTKPFILKRLKTPVEVRNDIGETDLKKYEIPKGAGTNPFITPGIIQKYENRETITTLVLTEGYFKAFKGYMHGLDIIGLSSITHVKDKETQMMYSDVLEVIKECKVKNVIILYDGDCRSISLKALDKGNDLKTRLDVFLGSMKTVAELLKDHVSVYFTAIESDEIEGKPKGLDDLYITFKDREKEITDDLLSISKPSRYFERIEITGSTTKVYKWFHVQDINDFYKFHKQWIKDKEFIFHGSKYKWDEKDNRCTLVAPTDVKDYFQVGDDYYKFVKIPNKYKHLETIIVRRQLATIKKLFMNKFGGKNFTDYIPYYEAFCNVPDHLEYAQIINNCFNMYSKFEHVPEEGECDTVLEFLKHIFGYQYDLGLDYIQLLYQRPQQMLPILCLVSKDNQTGKSTFIKFMKSIFTANAVIVGTNDLAGDFNFSWAGKLLICCEETFLEKTQMSEKLKSLSTGEKLLVNRKGKDHSEIDFFGKFILASNNEDRFVQADKYSERYWVIKVPVIKKRDPYMEKKLNQEIPAFLNFLNSRKLTTQNEDRMWFKPEIRRTAALDKLIAANKTAIESEMEYTLREMFIEFGYKAILLTVDAIRSELFKSKNHTSQFLRDKIIELFKPDRFKTESGKEVSKRFYWPRWDKSDDQQRIDKSAVFIGKPFIFWREDFLTESEQKEYPANPENEINDFAEKAAYEWLKKIREELPF